MSSSTTDRPLLVNAMLDAYLTTLQKRPGCRQANQVEIDALSSAARERRRSALQLFTH